MLRRSMAVVVANVDLMSLATKTTMRLLYSLRRLASFVDFVTTRIVVGFYSILIFLYENLHFI